MAIIATLWSYKKVTKNQRPTRWTAMVKHGDHGMTWYDYGHSYSPWYDRSNIMAWPLWDGARWWYGRQEVIKNSKVDEFIINLLPRGVQITER